MDLLPIIPSFAAVIAASIITFFYNSRYERIKKFLEQPTAKLTLEYKHIPWLHFGKPTHAYLFFRVEDDGVMKQLRIDIDKAFFDSLEVGDIVDKTKVLSRLGFNASLSPYEPRMPKTLP